MNTYLLFEGFPASVSHQVHGTKDSSLLTISGEQSQCRNSYSLGPLLCSMGNFKGKKKHYVSLSLLFEKRGIHNLT